MEGCRRWVSEIFAMHDCDRQYQRQGIPGRARTCSFKFWSLCCRHQCIGLCRRRVSVVVHPDVCPICRSLDVDDLFGCPVGQYVNHGWQVKFFFVHNTLFFWNQPFVAQSYSQSRVLFCPWTASREVCALILIQPWIPSSVIIACWPCSLLPCWIENHW